MRRKTTARAAIPNRHTGGVTEHPCSDDEHQDPPEWLLEDHIERVARASRLATAAAECRAESDHADDCVDRADRGVANPCQSLDPGRNLIHLKSRLNEACQPLPFVR